MIDMKNHILLHFKMDKYFLFFCEKSIADEIICEVSPKVSRGLGPCRPTLLIFSPKHVVLSITLFFFLRGLKSRFLAFGVCGEGFDLGSFQEP